MSKRVYFFGLAMSAVALAFVLAEQLFWEPGVSAASVRRIRPGMTLAEVEAILGGPSDTDLENQIYAAPVAKADQKATAQMDDEADVVKVVSRRTRQLEEIHEELFADQVSNGRVWKGDRGIATVQFDENDKVASARFDPETQAGLVYQLRSWLGW
jgi:hypothetical protein